MGEPFEKIRSMDPFTRGLGACTVSILGPLLKIFNGGFTKGPTWGFKHQAPRGDGSWVQKASLAKMFCALRAGRVDDRVVRLHAVRAAIWGRTSLGCSFSEMCKANAVRGASHRPINLSSQKKCYNKFGWFCCWA
ncbi:MAG: hypothetical protein WCJ99_04745 [Betaproteobacteria bacterium]|jgi:hypothetical protein